MDFSNLDWISPILRTTAYVGSIAVAGSVLVRATLNTTPVSKTINWQIIIGGLILLLCEPLRYVIFQLSIAQGDWVMAFDPAMRWIAIDTPSSQAAALRLLATIIVMVGFLWQPITVPGALILIGSFLLEGHTLLSDRHPVLAVLLFAHLTMVHWWISALIPLRTSLAGSDHLVMASLIAQFARKAVACVIILSASGLILLGELSGWKLRLTSNYQQVFVIKLSIFAVIVLIGAFNKLRWTPLLTFSPEAGQREAGQRGLRRAINVEIAVAAAILTATAIATLFPPQAD